MATITIKVTRKKDEKAIKSVVEALGLAYDISDDQADDLDLLKEIEEGRKEGRATKEDKQAFMKRLEKLKHGI